MAVSFVGYPVQSDQSVRVFRTRDFIEVHSGLSQTLALHVFWVSTLIFPLCMVEGTL